MKTVLTIVLIITGIIFAGSVLLMSPKGGLGLGIGGIGGGSNEYGSKKMIEGKLKRVAVISLVVFCLVVVILPYSN